MTHRRWPLIVLLAAQQGCPSTTTASVPPIDTGGDPDATTTIEAASDGGSDPATALWVGGNFSCVRGASGVVRCWGLGTYGSFGAGVEPDRPIPSPIPDLGDPVEIGLGSAFACARYANRAVRCWGDNGACEAGGLSWVEPTRTIAGGLFPGVDNAMRLWVGGAAACILRPDGHVQCWGSEAGGLLATGDSGPPNCFPGKYLDYPGGPILGDVTQVALGGVVGCALRRDGTVMCWGTNNNGAVGTGEAPGIYEPRIVADLTGVAEIRANGATVCVRTLDGRVACWGNNEYGLVGDGSFGPAFRPAFLAGVATAQQLTVGTNTACALLQDGTATCWGNMAGDGTRGVQGPKKVSSVNNIAEIHAGYDHACLRTMRGEIYCWGDSRLLGIGDSTTLPAYRLWPTRVRW